MPKKSTGRGYFGSTEPQARKVQKGIESRRKKKKKKKPTKYTGSKTTATSPEGVQKTTEEGLKELRKLREKQRRRSNGKK